MHAPPDALLNSPKLAIHTEEKVDKSNGIHEPVTVTEQNLDEISGLSKNLKKEEKISINASKESSNTEADVIDIFKGLAKKKKKSKKASNELHVESTSAEDSLPSSITEEEEGEVKGMFEGLAKKRKKSKKASNEIHVKPTSVEDFLPSSTTEEKDEEDLSKDLTKEKKEKSTKVGHDNSAETAESISAESPIIDAPAPKMITEEQAGEVTDIFKGLAKKKKSKITDKKTKSAEPTEAEPEAGLVDGGEEEGGDPDEGTGIWNHNAKKDLKYGQLLDRFFQILQERNPDMMSGKAKSYKIPPPQCVREGNKKTIFANIADICNRMDRSDDHVTSYLFAELGTSGSVDASRRLVIKGRFQQKQIENVLRRYISMFQLSFSHLPPPFPNSDHKEVLQNNSDFLNRLANPWCAHAVEYVTCKTCRSQSTAFSKGENRLYFVTCNSCSSRRSVTTVKTGFTAQVGKRKKMQA